MTAFLSNQKPTTNQTDIMAIQLKIDVSKISKPDLYQGKKGIYLDAILWENRDGQSQYGDDGYITQGISKEKRDAGERGPIIGNWKNMEKKADAPKAKPQAEEMADSDIPF
jgi:hypothetical protein